MAKKKPEELNPVKDTVVGQLMANPQAKSPRVVRGSRDTTKQRRGNASFETMKPELPLSPPPPTGGGQRVTFPKGHPMAQRIKRENIGAANLIEEVDAVPVERPTGGAPSESPQSSSTGSSSDFEELKKSRERALVAKQGHEHIYGKNLDESHPEYANRIELQKAYKSADAKFGKAQRELYKQRQNAIAGGATFSATDEAPVEALGTTHFEQYMGHIKRMVNARREAVTLSSPEERAKKLDEADGHKKEAQKMDAQLGITSLHESIHSVCSNDGCNGVNRGKSTAGLCDKCDAHEESFGEGSSPNRVKAKRMAILGTAVGSDPKAPFQPPANLPAVGTVTLGRRSKSEPKSPVERDVQGSLDRMVSDDAEDSWWTKQVNTLGLRRKRNPELLPDWAKPELDESGEPKPAPTPLQKRSEEVTNRFAQLQGQIESASKKLPQPPIGKSTKTSAASEKEIGDLRESGEADVYGRALPRQKPGRVDAFTEGTSK